MEEPLLIRFRLAHFGHFTHPSLACAPSGTGGRDASSRLHGNDGGVARSGETFNSVPFSCIWLHFLSPEPSPGFQPSLE